MMGSAYRELSEHDQRQIVERITAAAQPLTAGDGSVLLPGSCLVAIASA
jgi:hypothetical protein